MRLSLDGLLRMRDGAEIPEGDFLSMLDFFL